MRMIRRSGRLHERAPWASAASALAVAALLATAVGAPVAVAATRTSAPGVIVAADPTATDSPAPLASDSATPVPSGTASPTTSASSTASPSASDPGSPLQPGQVTGTLTPDTQEVRVIAGLLMDPTVALEPSNDFADLPTFTVDPKLPDGLWLSATNGTVHGTPTLAQDATIYTITADDGTTTATATISISVAPGLVPVTQTATGEIFDTLKPSDAFEPVGFPDVIADPLVYSIAPELPTGLEIDPKTGIVSGYVMTLETKTPFIVSATDGTFVAKAKLFLTTTCPSVYTPQVLPAECPPVAPLPADAGGVSPLMAAFVAAASDEIHGPLTDPTNAGSCATCHRTHSARNPNFLGATGTTQTALCYTCHDGTGAPDLQGPNVKAQFAIAPPNVVTPTSRAFYSHDVSAIATKAHQGAVVDEEAGSSITDEFGGVYNRHAECSDCHNPHASYIDPPTTDVSTMTPNGWTLSGRDYATPGVKADYAGVAPGAVPALTLLDGTVNPLTAEYQLCYKCHSSYTTLPSNAGMDPTSMIYDQSVEFNPANPSYHPVTAAGKNQTQAMKNSLAHASGTKLLWNFQSTDTIRCTNCHAQPSVSNANGGAGQVSAPHGSTNKYILLRRYEASTNGTSAVGGNDYDLCFGCHSSQPFENEGSADTNWADHFLHVGDKDLRCAECHGEIHSSTNVAGQVGMSRLMKFGPDVTAYNASTPMWSPIMSGGVQVGGACALRCHGQTHTGTGKYTYTYTP